MDWKELIRTVANELERHVDRRRPGPRGRPVIAPYRGFGRGNEMILRGRVLGEKAVTRAQSAEPVWRNVLNAYRRFQSDELAGVKVRASYRDAVVETVTDEEGHFQVRLQPALIDQDRLWHEMALALPDRDGEPTTGHVLIPPPAARFGVISDIDDTIVVTGATSMREMVRTVLLQNAASRLPFEGVADLYRLLHGGTNPIFYVSSSPWNLYDLLHDYMELNQIPHGPMFLQDYGIDADTWIHDPHDVHKLREIQTILDYYAPLPFVLIGDSGQHDPEIYLRVIQANPGRILLAIIRDVTPASRDEAMGKIADEARAAGVEMAYVSSSAEAQERVVRLLSES